MSTDLLTIVWIRNDFRVYDNPALAIAAAHCAVLPVFIWDEASHGDWAPGAASRVWLHHSLGVFNYALGEFDSALVIRQGDSLAVLQELVKETGATRVVWNRRHEPALARYDARVMATLKDDGVVCSDFQCNLLYRPGAIRTQNGDPYKVFTPFWKACQLSGDPMPPVEAPQILRSFPALPESLKITDLNLLPEGEGDWAEHVMGNWEVGEKAAAEALHDFLDYAVYDYDTDRDRPDLNGTSMLSPYLHFGEISVRRIWAELGEVATKNESQRNSLARFRAELGWREFATHLLHHFPETVSKPLRAEFNDFPWLDDRQALQTWQRGQTGFPMVDAGMRQLWNEGWMHNRVRMIVASFLTKDLLIPWQEGARWFWETLVDADLANNTLGWQWTAGCGADAAPYFRIFNPVTQGQRYDPDGDYIREYIPELRAIEGAKVHEPWKSGKSTKYPSPMLDHKEARERALLSYDVIRKR